MLQNVANLSLTQFMVPTRFYIASVACLSQQCKHLDSRMAIKVKRVLSKLKPGLLRIQQQIYLVHLFALMSVHMRRWHLLLHDVWLSHLFAHWFSRNRRWLINCFHLPYSSVHCLYVIVAKSFRSPLRFHFVCKCMCSTDSEYAEVEEIHGTRLRALVEY